MPQGIQAWDANGVMTLDVTDRLTRIIGVVTVPSGTLSSGSVTVPSNFYQGNQVFAQMLVTELIPQAAAYGSLTISGPTITYTNLRNGFIYGVF